MRFKGLIFDKDGTLFHFQESWGDWLDEVLEILSGDSIEKKQKMLKRMPKGNKKFSFNVK